MSGNVLLFAVLCRAQIPAFPFEYDTAFKQFAVNSDKMNELVDESWAAAFKPQAGAPGDPDWNKKTSWALAVATERVTQLITDEAMLADQIMHAMRHNRNTRKLGTPIMWLPIRATGAFPTTEISYYMDFLNEKKWSASKCEKLLKKYVVSDYQSTDILAPSKEPCCMQLMEYLGLPITGEEDVGDYLDSAAPGLGVYRR